MICWGERDCCGVFNEHGKSDNCDCLRDRCIRDFPLKERILVDQSNLDSTLYRLYGNYSKNYSELKSMLQIKSISSSVEHQGETQQIIDRLAQRLNELEFDVEQVELKPTDEGPAHYVILAKYFSTPIKNVMLVYGHVKVPPVGKDDGWTKEPYDLTEEDKMLYGCGVATSKGPVLCWLHAIEAWLQANNDLPVNMLLIIDTLNDGNNPQLKELISERVEFFKGVDLLVTNTNMWIRPDTPMLTTSHSGYVNFELEVTQQKAQEPNCSQPVREPMSELCLLMGALTDIKGELKAGLERHVLPVTQRDWDILCAADVSIVGYKRQLNVKQLREERSKPLFLKQRWCMPGLTMHGVVHQPYASQRDFTKPTRVVARFSFKLVPDQSVDFVSYMIQQHLDGAYRHFKCQQLAYLRVLDSLTPLNEARNAPFSLVAQRAFDSVFAVQAAIPDTIHSCNPTINRLRKYCTHAAQVIGLPFCSIRTNPGQPDECISSEKYKKNLELCATMLYEVALVPTECKCSEIKNYCYEAAKVSTRDFITIMEDHNTSMSHVLYELHETHIPESTSKDRLPSATSVMLGQRSKKLA